MNTIINTGAVIALYLSIFIITKKNRNNADIFLFVFFIINSIIFFISFISFEYGYKDLQFFLINIDLLTTPLFYIYIYLLISGSKASFKQVLFNLLPYGISFLYLGFMAISLTSNEFDILIYKPLLEQPKLLALISIMEFMVVPYYALLSLRLLYIHNRKISGIYSFQKGVDLKWLKTLIVLMVLGWLSMYIPYFVSPDSGMALGLTINGFLILYLGFFGIKQTTVFTEPKKDEKYKKSAVSEYSLNSYKDRLLKYMSQYKPYLDNELTIYKLAKGVDIPSHHLSQVLSTGINKSFYDFINYYRVEEFKEYIKSGANKDYTLLSIAMDSGFNSKSSFNRIFKNVTGVTPSSYISSL